MIKTEKDLTFIYIRARPERKNQCSMNTTKGASRKQRQRRNQEPKTKINCPKIFPSLNFLEIWVARKAKDNYKTTRKGGGQGDAKMIPSYNCI